MTSKQTTFRKRREILRQDADEREDEREFAVVGPYKRLPPAYRHYANIFRDELSGPVHASRLTTCAHTKLNLQLLKCIRLRDFEKAARILMLVCRRMSNDTPELLWRVGCEILGFAKEDMEEDEMIKCLQFYQFLQQSGFRTDFGTHLFETLVLEITFFCVRMGDIADAFQRLDHAISTSRCGISWLHRCYAGYLAFRLWDDPDQPLVYFYSLHQRQAVSLEYKRAIQHFELAIEDMSEREIVEFRFIPLVIKLLLVDKRMSYIRAILGTYKNLDSYKLEYLLFMVYYTKFLLEIPGDDENAPNVESAGRCHIDALRELFEFDPTFTLLQELKLKDPASYMKYICVYLSHQRSLGVLKSLPDEGYLDSLLRCWADLNDLISETTDINSIYTELSHHFHDQISFQLLSTLNDQQHIQTTRTYLAKYALYKKIRGQDAYLWKPVPAHRKLTDPQPMHLDFLKTAEGQALMTNLGVTVSEMVAQ